MPKKKKPPPGPSKADIAKWNAAAPAHPVGVRASTATGDAPLSGIGDRFSALTDLYHAYKKSMGDKPTRKDSRGAIHGFMRSLMDTGLSHQEAAWTLYNEFSGGQQGAGAGLPMRYTKPPEGVPQEVKGHPGVYGTPLGRKAQGKYDTRVYQEPTQALDVGPGAFEYPIAGDKHQKMPGVAAAAYGKTSQGKLAKDPSPIIAQAISPYVDDQRGLWGHVADLYDQTGGRSVKIGKGKGSYSVNPISDMGISKSKIRSELGIPEGVELSGEMIRQASALKYGHQGLGQGWWFNDPSRKGTLSDMIMSAGSRRATAGKKGVDPNNPDWLAKLLQGTYYGNMPSSSGSSGAVDPRIAGLAP